MSNFHRRAFDTLAGLELEVTNEVLTDNKYLSGKCIFFGGRVGCGVGGLMR